MYKNAIYHTNSYTLSKEQRKDIKNSNVIFCACMRNLKQILTVYVSIGGIWIARSKVVIFIYVVLLHSFKKH